MVARKLFSSFFIGLMIIPLLFSTILTPFANAQEGVPSLSSEGTSIAMDFFQVNPDSFKFNGIGFGSDGLIRNASLPSLPLHISGGLPYDLQVINKGNTQQMVNGTLNTVYEWELWYKYTISMYTLGRANLFTAPFSPITKIFYYQGWGADPTGAGKEAEVYITFENYDLSPTWRQQVETWGWLGKLNFDISINPEFAFPPNVTVINGAWLYKDVHFGFLPTIFMHAEQGYAEDFNIHISGATVQPLTDSPTDPALTDGRYPSQSYDAHYDNFLPSPEVSNHSLYAPSNNTPCIARAKATNRSVEIPDNFDLSALSLLDQQRVIEVEIGGIEMKPAFMVIGGTHMYTFCSYYTGLLHGQEWLILGIGSPYKTILNFEEDVTLGWAVKNVYQTLHFQTGVRLLTLYEWDPTGNTNQTLGNPQGPPNTNTGDDILDDGITGAVGAKGPLTMWEIIQENLWLIVIAIVALASIYVVKKIQGGGRAKIKQTINLNKEGL